MQNLSHFRKWSKIKRFGEYETAKRRKFNSGHFLYVPKSVKNLLSVSMLLYKGAIMAATKDNMMIKKNGVSGSSYLFTTCLYLWLATVLYSRSGVLTACLIFTVGTLLLSEQLGPSLCRPLGAQEWPSVTICHRQPGRDIQQGLGGW